MESAVSRLLSTPFVITAMIAAVWLLVIYLAVSYARRSIGRYVVDSGTRYRARKIVSFGGYFLAAGVLATLFSDRLSGLTVAFGLAGAGIAFALQEVIVSVAGWVAICFGHTYQTGDRVQIGGVRGDVIDIGVLRTTLMELGQWVNGDLYNGRIVRVSNSVLFKDPVFNYSADFPFLWDEIMLPIRYGSDWKAARDMMRRIADEIAGDFAAASLDEWRFVVQKYKIDNAQIEPVVTITANENWVEFTTRYIVDYKKRRSTKDRFFVRILEEVDRSEGAIRIATASMELSSSPSLDLRILDRQQTA